jgi:hypothetical protein
MLPEEAADCGPMGGESSVAFNCMLNNTTEKQRLNSQ